MMYTWEWNIVEWPNLGFVTLVETALLVPLWEYLILALLLASIWLYYILDFHFVDDLLHGFRGEVPRLHFSSASYLTSEVLATCKILKQRYFATPWLSSPHLQTMFLHFNGNPPPVKYHRQIYVTPDKGTIALDWVKHPLNDDKGYVDINQENVEIDESPIVIIIPGLTSDSESPYIKHIAYNSAMMGWRTLVTNHRGLGGLSMTSDIFYNAGWTEDLRRIVNYVHGKYPKAPIFTIGTSIGANILVKYLGEEGDSTPVGAAAAVCSPWDLLVADRFISRNRMQRLYNRVLAIGLVEYAKIHQSVLARIADWSYINKSKTVRDFDHHCTRHIGKYETVDTYYRRCSSADFLMKVRVPLLCFSALDDPVCSSEAIPWDEILENPNVAMVVTKHGGHLAYFEGFTGRTIWWTRALIEFMTIMIPSNLMHTPQKVSEDEKKFDLNVCNGPYVNVSSSGLVAAEDLKPPNLANLGQEGNFNESDIIVERKGSADNKLPDDVYISRDFGDEDGSLQQTSVTLSFKDNTEISSLHSALLQLQKQLQALPPVAQQSQCESRGCRADQHDAEVNSKHSTLRALRDCAIQATEIPKSPALRSPLINRREIVTKRALPDKCYHRFNMKDSKFGSGTLSSPSNRVIAEKSTPVGNGEQKSELRASNFPGYTWLAAQHRRTLCLLTYIALVTTCPWLGTAVFLWWRRKAVNITTRMLRF
ncbi:uncharacterized protein [Physcomitrium patens]|uniref:AB hydrolase-1 domain-containing protein n=2 Tax=Physcomitrium patens TaxID=3218 RepID=A0A2K1ICP6_PHYPA|nr:uncharacterized protein LOC112277677 [Physcomitrium patens]XP_024366044.1 uncharacterized protein LOC112277677 [Physcomitrium patens]XP_024366045.1 uncharacterized protein LOC112277677 [Physcomitrium patens]XP_024366046.1 uncharacterized protein LOC112277677 [Physcomitrium patens]PNR27036.1 hypothetical protein PHYPA_030517 [Physcomitrium patens]|eukprot:XP_024366043.1 uncharacterized protein LOC112277677 [Physcomitrella patens]